MCKEKKPQEEFYYITTKKRYDSKCKACTKNGGNKRIKNLPVKERRALWRKATAKSQKKLPEHVEARKLVKAAVLRGELVKPLDCEMSNISSACYGRLDGHHDDYSKPLEVRWLCHRHHRATHYPNAYPSIGRI